MQEFLKKMAMALSGGYQTGMEMLAPKPEDLAVRAKMGELLASATPGIGDAMSGYDTVKSAAEGNYGEAALNGVGLLPFVPAMGGVIKFPGGMIKADRSAAIKNMAEDFASQLNAKKFNATVDHSGSVVGPSSYVRVFDPETGRFLVDPVRFSDHAKGPNQGRFVNDVSGSFDAPETKEVLSIIDEMRAKGPTDFWKSKK